MTNSPEPGFALTADAEGTVVVRDGHPQSFVDLDDPTNLAFEYVALIACCIEALAPAGTLRTTHIGGAGLTLPRWLQHTRPGSPQIVLEPDAALTEAVRRDLPLPRGHRIRVRPVDGRSGIAALADGSADLIILDAYADGQVPADLVTTEFFSHVARVLAPSGLFLANLADDKAFRWAPRVAAGARGALGHTAYVALQEVLKGRRYGNGTLVAGRQPVDLDEISRALRRLPLTAGAIGDGQLQRRLAGQSAFTDADTQASPEPPHPGRWRT